MSLELTLLPVEPFDNPDAIAFYSHTVLKCEDREYEHLKSSFYETIIKLEKKKGIKIKKFNSLLSREDGKSAHYGPTTKSPYGEPLKYLTGEDLHPFSWEFGVKDSSVNIGVWAWLAAMPSHTKFVLYWH